VITIVFVANIIFWLKDIDPRFREGEDSSFNDIPSLVEHRTLLASQGKTFDEKKKAEYFIENIKEDLKKDVQNLANNIKDRANDFAALVGIGSGSSGDGGRKKKRRSKIGFEAIPEEEEEEEENQEEEGEGTEGKGDLESGGQGGRKQQKRPSYSSGRGSVANPILTAALSAGKTSTTIGDIEMTGQPDHPAYLEETMPLKSSTSSTASKKEVIKEKIRDFYRQYNPTKLDSVDEILIKYQGKEELLLQKLHKQYDVAP
jgi:hypothetical protein